MTVRHAWGYGLATVAENGAILDVWFPTPTLGSAPEQSSPYEVPADLVALELIDPNRRVRQSVIRIQSDLDTPPADAADAYLRLHLISHRLVKPHEVDLSGIFSVLHNVVWTDHGPCPVEDFEATRLRLRAATGRRVSVVAIDKIPRMVDYVVPTGIRIADADRVRLGAYLAAGTTVMHEGFVNYNAGTLGSAMVEGRISQGVVIGEGSDVGGGASIMGTLSGGGKVVVSIGEHSLLGANAGIGISLGDHCIVEAGLYVTAGTKILLTDAAGSQSTVKGAALSGIDHLLFRRNSVTGGVEAQVRNDQSIELNTDLHKN